MLILIRIHIFLPFYYTATNMTSIGILIKFLGEIYKHMFSFLLTTTRPYDIIREYRDNVACILLLCLKVGMKVSPCNEESCAEGIRSACAEQVLRDVSAHQAPHPSRLERRAMTVFLVVRIFRKSTNVIVSLRTCRDGLF